MTEEKKETTEKLNRLIPPVDIYETENDVILLADVPGLTKDNLKLDINKDELAIEGVFAEPKEDGETLLSECTYGKYERTFILADTIDRDKITAKLENGVLTLTLPKQEKAKPRKIAIEAE